VIAAEGCGKGEGERRKAQTECKELFGEGGRDSGPHPGNFKSAISRKTHREKRIPRRWLVEAGQNG